MTGAERGFLLLTGYLGDPARKPLTVAQFRDLTVMARNMERPISDRDLTEKDLTSLGCSGAYARRILELLSQGEQLQWYVNAGKRFDCLPVTRISPDYPDSLRKRLGAEAPGVLWMKGELSLLGQRMLSLVGSRDLGAENASFAWEVGKQAARQGWVLVSGNARGADQTAQESCLEHGGSVIVVVADALRKCPLRKNCLYISEEGYDLGFSAHRALQRNRVIHSLGSCTLVAQCTLEKGGTWDGTCKNLRRGWSPVFCFRDGSRASRELEAMGAALIDTEALADMAALKPGISGLL